MEFFRSSRRGQAIVALGTGAVLGSVLTALGLWHIGLVALTTSLVLILALLSEGQHKLRVATIRARTETQRSAQTIGSSVAKVLANQKSSIDASAGRNRATPRFDAAPSPTKAHRSGALTPEVHSKVESQRRTVEDIDTWVSSTRLRGSQLRRSTGGEILDALYKPACNTTLHIGDVESAIWTYGAISHPTTTVERAGFLFVTQAELEEFRSYTMQHPQHIEMRYGLLKDNPPPAGSLAGLVAYEVDLLIIDFGCVNNPVDVTAKIPRLFWRWLRNQAVILIIDSKRASPALAVEFILGQNFDLMTVAENGPTYARRMKRVVN